MLRRTLVGRAMCLYCLKNQQWPDRVRHGLPTTNQGDAELVSAQDISGKAMVARRNALSCSR
jgi:hypothetical protein